ncbi:MAG: hypothetical protein ACRDYV_06910 [Acidimicrobiia bacterium]
MRRRRFVRPLLIVLGITLGAAGTVPPTIRLVHERRYCTSTWRAGHEARQQMIELNRTAEAAGEPAPYGIVATGGPWSTGSEYRDHCLARQRELRTGFFGLWSKDSED